MGRYSVSNVPIEQLWLDEKNPRFIIPPNPTQQSIVNYLLDYEEVEQLARDIIIGGGLYAGERIIVIKEADKFIVVEGNRRVCACKILAPERMIYEMLVNFDDEDLFWDNSMSGFSKAVCFRDYPNYLENIDDIKCWFKGQKGNAGRGYSKFLSEWKKRNTKEVKQFIGEFIDKYNYVARQTGFSEIDYEG